MKRITPISNDVPQVIELSDEEFESQQVPSLQEKIKMMKNKQRIKQQMFENYDATPSKNQRNSSRRGQSIQKSDRQNQLLIEVDSQSNENFGPMPSD